MRHLNHKVRVRKWKSGDWLMTCYDHGETVWCGSWWDAYEAAVGHFVLFHKMPCKGGGW